jgi:hypothetical protein
VKTTSFVIALCLFLLAIAGCGAATDCTKPENASSAKCTVINSVLQCTGAVLPAAEASASKDLNDLLAKARGADGTVDLSTVETQLEDLGIKYGGCVMADLFSRFTSGKVGASPTGGPNLAPETAKQEFNLLRARLWPGRAFQTEGGQL